MKLKLTNNYEKVITECYESDPDLLSKYHILAPTALKWAVLHTVNNFNETEGFKMYQMVDNGKFMGYIGVAKSDLKFVHGFFVMPKYRSKVVFEFFFDSIRRLVGENAFIPVWKKNTRACLFLEKNKCKFVKELKDDENGQLINIYKLCQ